jgi:hypothetical protein
MKLSSASTTAPRTRNGIDSSQMNGQRHQYEQGERPGDRQQQEPQNDRQYELHRVSPRSVQ